MTIKSPNSKVKEICDLVLRETLQPAKEEAHRTIEEAKREAEKIVREAKAQALKIEEENKLHLNKQLEVHSAELQLSINKALAHLKELITNVFSSEIEHLLSLKLEEEDVIGDLVNALVTSIEKEGIKGDLRVLIPQKVSIPVVQGKLLQMVREKIGSEGIKLGHFKAGVILKFVDKKMAISVTEESVKELLSLYLDDLKERLFLK